MKKTLLFIVIFCTLTPRIIRAQDGDPDYSSSVPADAVSAPSDATPTESTSTEVVPEAMEEATFDDVSE